MGETKGILGGSVAPCKDPKCAGIKLTFYFYIVWGYKDPPTCNLSFGQAQDTIPTLCK